VPGPVQVTVPPSPISQTTATGLATAVTETAPAAAVAATWFHPGRIQPQPRRQLHQLITDRAHPSGGGSGETAESAEALPAAEAS